MVPSDIFVYDLYKPSVDHKEDGGSDHPPADPAPTSEASAAPEPEAMDIKPEEPAPGDLLDWCYPLLQRLIDGTLPSDQAEAQRVACRAKAFVQAPSLRRPHVLHHPLGRNKAPSGDTLGGLRPSRRTSDASRKCLLTRFLLAHRCGRWHSDRLDL